MASRAASIFRGADKALADIKKLRAFAPDEFAAALYQEGQIELKEIKKRTPVAVPSWYIAQGYGKYRGIPGALRASEGVTRPQREGRRIFMEVYAGGPSAPYAAAVHWDLEAFHLNGEAMYIERVLQESRPFMAARIAARINLNRAL